MNAKPLRVLIVQDYPVAKGNAFADWLRCTPGFSSVKVAENAKEATEFAGRETFDVFVVDWDLPDQTGLELAPLLEATNPEAVLVIWSDKHPLRYSLDTLRRGYDILTKGATPQDLLTRVEEIRRDRLAVPSTITLWDDKELYIGHSRAMRDAALAAIKCARAIKGNVRDSVWLDGESGTGKDLFARLLHHERYQPDPKSRPFVPINSRQIGDETAHAELFGTVPHIYTGVGAAPGILKAAQDGTLFLDEIDKAGKKTRDTLLRFLQDKTIRPSGATKGERIDLWPIFAGAEFASTDAVGKPVEDFVGRLVYTIRVPPLREWLDDLEGLATSLLRQMGCEIPLEEEVLDTFRAYTWPHNVRELENALDHMVHQGRARLDLSIVPQWLHQRMKATASRQGASQISPSEADLAGPARLAPDKAQDRIETSLAAGLAKEAVARIVSTSAAHHVQAFANRYGGVVIALFSDAGEERVLARWPHTLADLVMNHTAKIGKYPAWVRGREADRRWIPERCTERFIAVHAKGRQAPR